MPIGNLTSQLFANIYLNEFDQFVKHNLKIKYYLRYTDDFIVVSEDREYLQNLIEPIEKFLKNELRLSLHPNKVFVRKYQQGIDFLGYIILPHYILVRTRTRRRIMRKLKMRIHKYEQGLITKESLRQSLASYLGVLSHANNFGFLTKLIKLAKIS